MRRRSVGRRRWMGEQGDLQLSYSSKALTLSKTLPLVFLGADVVGYNNCRRWGMLERFRRHIVSGARCFLRNKRQKRMLHSSFWLHGAEELTPLLGSLSVCVRGMLTTEVELLNRRIMEESLHLEFLYPLKTLAFLKQFSRHGPSTPLLPLTHRQKHQSGRCYSTETKKEERQSVEATDSKKYLFKNLSFFCGAAGPGHYDEAWHHIQNDTDIATPHQINMMLEYLGASDRKEDQIRIMELGERLPVSKFESRGCEALTKVLLDRGLADDAYLLVSKIAEVNSMTAMRAVGRLIAYGINEDQWPLALRAFNLLPESPIDNTRLIAPQEIVVHVNSFQSKYLAWLEGKPSGAYSPSLALSIGIGGLVAALSRKTSEGALEGYHILKAFYREGWGAQIRWSMWLDLMLQLQGYNHHEPATDVYLVYRDMPLRESPTAEEVAKLLYGTLRSFGHLQDFRNMQRVFDDWFHFGSRPSQEACLYIMRTFASRGEVSVVRDFYNYFVDRFPISTAVISVMMHVHTVRGEAQEVFKWFEKLAELRLSPTRLVYNILLNAYKQSDNIDAAFRRFHIMYNSKSESKPDLITYQTLMSLCANRGDVEAVEHLLEKMKEQGIKPNQSILNAVTYAYVKIRDLETTQWASIIANEVFKSRDQKNDMKSNPTRMWNNILVGYLWTQDLSQVAATYHQMRTEKVPFDSYTYAILMHSLCLSGKVSEADRMLDMLEKEGIVRLNQTHYASIMLDHMLRKDISKVWFTYNRMLRAGLSPTFIVQAILIQVVATAEYREYRKSGGVLFLREAEAILAQSTSDLSILDLQSPDKVKSAIPPFLFIPLLQIYAKEGSHERALELFQKFMEIQEEKKPSNTTPDLTMYLHVGNALLRSGNTKLLLEIWKEAKEAALKLSKRVIHGLPIANEREKKTVLPKYSRILCSLFSVVIRALSLDRDMKQLAWERDELLYHGFQLDNININDMVQALILNSKPVQAFTLCETALMPGYIDRTSELRGENYSTPDYFPFLRTLECLLTGVHIYLHMPAHNGLSKEEGESAMHKIEKQCPKTWAVLNEMDSVEHRIVKERIYQRSRLDWGRQDLERVEWPAYEENADNTLFIDGMIEDLKRDIVRRKRARTTGNWRKPDVRMLEDAGVIS